MSSVADATTVADGERYPWGVGYRFRWWRDMDKNANKLE